VPFQRRRPERFGRKRTPGLEVSGRIGPCRDRAIADSCGSANRPRPETSNRDFPLFSLPWRARLLLDPAACHRLRYRPKVSIKDSLCGAGLTHRMDFCIDQRDHSIAAPRFSFSTNLIRPTASHHLGVASIRRPTAIDGATGQSDCACLPVYRRRLLRNDPI